MNTDKNHCGNERTRIQTKKKTKKKKQKISPRRHGDAEKGKIIVHHRGHRGTRRIIWATKEREDTRIQKKKNLTTLLYARGQATARKRRDSQNHCSPQRTQRN